MSPLSRDDILGSDDRRTVTVDVPEWGGGVIVRAMSGTERDSYEASMVTIKADGSRKFNLGNLRARLVCLTCVDVNGNRLFREDDIRELGEKSAAALERVFDAARKLSGLTDDDVEELAEGFGDAPSGDSTSA